MEKIECDTEQTNTFWCKYVHKCNYLHKDESFCNWRTRTIKGKYERDDSNLESHFKLDKKKRKCTFGGAFPYIYKSQRFKNPLTESYHPYNRRTY